MFNDFCIVIDTREQNALFLKKPPKGVLIMRSTLDVGDYSVRGFEGKEGITIERKSLLDFLSSISHDRERFKKELVKMKEYSRKCIVIEASLKELLEPVYRPTTTKKGYIKPVYRTKINIHPNSVYQTIISIMMRYDVNFWFASTKKEAEEFVYSILKKFYVLKRAGEL